MPLPPWNVQFLVPVLKNLILLNDVYFIFENLPIHPDNIPQMMILFILSNYIHVICYLLDIKIYINNIDVVMRIDYSQLIRSK